MGAGPRFSVDFVRFLGVGISYSDMPYEYTIFIELPFISIQIGLGKSYTEK